MKNPKRAHLVDLESIMELLSDIEAASVSTAEARGHLAEGDEFIDLRRIEQGVLRADGVQQPTDDILPRKAIPVQTWERIVALLKGTP
jgi:hypothetical protein